MFTRRLACVCLVASAVVMDTGTAVGAEHAMHEVAIKAERPAGAPVYSDVCFRYGWVRADAFPTIEDAKQAIQAFHATRVDWFYPGSHTADPGATYVTETSRQFIDWCHARGMKVGGAMNTLTTHKAWDSGGSTNNGRFRGDPGNPDYVAAAVAWGKAQIDAGVDTLVCDDVFGLRGAEKKKAFSEKVIEPIKAHKKGFTLAGNNGGMMGTGYVKSYAFDFHYSDNSYLPGPGKCWAASKEHRAVHSAVLLHPNKRMSTTRHRILIAHGYAVGAHVITPWDQYIHGGDRKRLFADPADFADLYGFVRSLGQDGYLDGYEDTAVGGYELKETRYGDAPPITISGGSGKLSAFARAKPGQADAPVVIHLVESGEGKPAKLHVQRSALFGERNVVCQFLAPSAYDADAHQAAATSGDYKALRRVATLEPVTEDGVVAVEVPALMPWGTLVISPAD